MKRPWKPKCCRCWRLGIPPMWLVISGAIGIQLGYGFYPIFVKKFATEKSTNPFIFGLYRILGSFPVLVLCTFVAERKMPIPGLKMTLVLMVLGFTGTFISQVAYVAAIYKVGPSISSAMQPIVAVWTAILAIATCTEKISSPKMLHTWMKLLGIILVSGGAIEIGLTGLHGGNKDTDSNNVGDQLLGYFFLFINTFATAIFIVVQKRFVSNKRDSLWRERPVAISTYSALFGILFSIPVYIYFIATGKTDEFIIPLESIFALEYGVFISSACCIMLSMWVILHAPATLAAAFWPLQVPIAVVGSYLVVGEKLVPWQYAGIAILLTGIMLVIVSNYMTERAARGRKVVRLDCCLKTYRHAVLVDAETEELSDEAENLASTPSESLELKDLADVDRASVDSVECSDSSTLLNLPPSPTAVSAESVL